MHYPREKKAIILIHRKPFFVTCHNSICLLSVDTEGNLKYCVFLQNFFYVPGYICRASFTLSKFECINKNPAEGRMHPQLIDFDSMLVGRIQYNA